MRRRRHVHQDVVRPLRPAILAGGEVVQRRIFDREIALAHGAADVDDRMTRRTCQACPGFRRVDLLLDGAIEAAVEEHGVIVAAGTPFRRLRANHILHVLDRLAIPLVVERGEMMCRRVPLVVDLAVAPAAHLAGHEEVRRNGPADVGARRRREERRPGAAAFFFHLRRDAARIVDAKTTRPLVGRERPERNRHQQDDTGRGDGGEAPCAKPVVHQRGYADPQQSDRGCHAESGMDDECVSMRSSGANVGEVNANSRSRQQYQHSACCHIIVSGAS